MPSTKLAANGISPNLGEVMCHYFCMQGEDSTKLKHGNQSLPEEQTDANMYAAEHKQTSNGWMEAAYTES